MLAGSFAETTVKGKFFPFWFRIGKYCLRLEFGRRKEVFVIRRPFYIVVTGMILGSMLLCLNLWAAESSRYAVLAGSFSSTNSALNLLGDLRLNGFDCQPFTVGRTTSVVCGDFDNSMDAERLNRSQKKEYYQGTSLLSSGNGFAPDRAKSMSMSKEYLTVQMGSFLLENNIEKALNDLKSKGIECRSRMLDNLFKIYCGQFTRSKDAIKLKERIIGTDYSSAFVKTLPAWPFFVDVPTPRMPKQSPLPRRLKKSLPPRRQIQSPPPPVLPLPVPDELYRKAPLAVTTPAPAPEPEVVKERQGIDGSIFGKGGGHLHPFVSVTGFYSDNIYGSNQNKVADLNTVLTGGLWISAPGTKKLMLQSVSGALPGGLQGSSFIRESKLPYQAYMLYKVDSENYMTYDAGNFMNHKGEGLLALNGDAGHRVEVSGIYLRSHDAKGQAPSLELAEFKSTRVGITANVAVTSKIYLRADYGKFTIDYDNGIYLYKEHKDSSYSGYIYFKFMPLFLYQSYLFFS